MFFFIASKVNESVEVLVENVNDNPPNFAQSHFVLEVNEVSGVAPPNVWSRSTLAFTLRLPQLAPINSTVGLVEATDVDSQPLFYRLEPATVRTCRIPHRF